MGQSTHTQSLAFTHPLSIQQRLAKTFTRRVTQWRKRVLNLRVSWADNSSEVLLGTTNTSYQWCVPSAISIYSQTCLQYVQDKRYDAKALDDFFSRVMLLIIVLKKNQASRKKTSNNRLLANTDCDICPAMVTVNFPLHRRTHPGELRRSLTPPGRP